MGSSALGFGVAFSKPFLLYVTCGARFLKNKSCDQCRPDGQPFGLPTGLGKPLGFPPLPTAPTTQSICFRNYTELLAASPVDHVHPVAAHFGPLSNRRFH